MKLIKRVLLRLGLKKIKLNEDDYAVTNNSCEIVLMNNYVEIVNAACRECYGGDPNTPYKEKLRNIGARVKAGHESVTEHSNIVMMLKLNNTTFRSNALLEFMAAAKFLDFEIDSLYKIVLIGGSILGYKQAIRHIKELSNPIVQMILAQLYNIEKCFFSDFIEAGIMQESKFNENAFRLIPVMKPIPVDLETMTVYNADSLEELKLKTESHFSDYQLAKFITVTVRFDEVSRVITQQITRHRNAISQRSQRYVSETDGKFIEPLHFKQKGAGEATCIKWDGKSFNTQQLGNYLMGVYKACSDAGMKKEDARSYLPNNTASSLIMTFRGNNLIHFVNMRADSHAQAETQTFGYAIKEILPIIFGKPIDEVLALNKPYYEYCLTDHTGYYDIDEVISEERETINV